MKSRISTQYSRKALLLVAVLVFFTSTACLTTNVLQRVFGFGGGVEKSVDILEDEMAREDCPATGPEFEAYWEDHIYPDLVYDKRNCSKSAVNVFKNCLKVQVLQGGKCLTDAQQACQEEFEVIPLNEGGDVTVATVDLVGFHSSAEQVTASLTYNSGGGTVNGDIQYQIKDMHVCTIIVKSTLSGNYDLEACTMSGTAQVTEIYEGAACASVCSASPDAEVACPVTISDNLPWQATLEDGVLSGGVNGTGSEVSGFGFRSKQ
jgi:hypothetical protein